MKLIYSFLFLFSMVSTVMMSPWESSTEEMSSESCGSEGCRVPQDTLQTIFVVKCHAATGSAYFLPKTPVDSNCNVVPNQVTAAGVRQTKMIVEALKNRYGSFLPTNASQAYFRCTNLDRTIDTIEIEIGCLFPTKKGQNSPIFFNPPRILDGLYYGVYCPAADQEIYYNNLLTSEAAAFNKSNTKLYSYLAEKTGLSADVNIIEAVYDFLSTLKYNGCKLPSFYSDKLLAEVTRQTAALYNLYYSSNLAKTLEGGTFAAEILRRIDYFFQASAQPSCDQPQIPLRKLHLYETHTENIAAFLAVLGHPLTSPIQSGSTVILELHNIDGVETVRAFQLPDTESTPIGDITPLSLSGSTSGVTLDAFKASVISYLPFDFDKQCQIPCTFDYHQNFENFVSETNDLNGFQAQVPE